MTAVTILGPKITKGITHAKVRIFGALCLFSIGYNLHINAIVSIIYAFVSCYTATVLVGIFIIILSSLTSCQLMKLGGRAGESLVSCTEDTCGPFSFLPPQLTSLPFWCHLTARGVARNFIWGV